MSKNFWYKMENGSVVNLVHAVHISLYTPTDQRYFPKRPDGQQTWAVTAQWPTPNEYGKSVSHIFWGSPEEVTAEHDRIIGLLTSEIGDEDE